MKRYLLFISLIILSCTAPELQSINQELDKQQISALLDQQVEDWNDGDIEAFMEGYWKSPDLKFIGSTGIKYGWQETLDGYHERYPTKEHMGTLNFVILKMEIIAQDNYLVIGEFHLERTIGNADGIFSLLLKRINGHWVVIADHTS